MFRCLLNRIRSWWQRDACAQPASPLASIPQPVSSRVERVILTDAVARVLFDEYRTHRESERGEEEIGWLLMGFRQDETIIATATLPAGTQREAGVAHVRFNSEAQALASRIVRQKDKRLAIVGIVHTHPVSLRCPSNGDFQGDSLWVRKLRGGEGVFAIGTADARPDGIHDAPDVHRQYVGALCFSWYALTQGDADYRRIPVQVASGADLAEPLHAIWAVLEMYAEPLNRLCRQLAQVQFEISEEGASPLLIVKIALSLPNQQLRLLLNEQEARYYWYQQGEAIAIDPHEPQVDRAVYLILAELAKEPTLTPCESPTLVES